MDLNEFDTTVTRIWENYGPLVLNMGRRIIIAILIIIGGRIVITVSRRLLNKAVSGAIHFDETFASVLRMLIQYAVIIICLIMILDILGVNTTGLIALLGAAGVAVGFALKDTLSNIAAGIIILFLRPFRKGDYIECGPASGTVTEIGLFATNLETPDGIFIAAPNSSLWGVPLKNYSHNTKRRMDVTVSISYTDSVDTAFKALTEILNSEPRFLKTPPPQVMVQSLGESGINITMRTWVPSGDYWPLYWAYMKKVKEKVEEAGLSIALPKREIQLIEKPAAKAEKNLEEPVELEE